MIDAKEFWPDTRTIDDWMAALDHVSLADLMARASTSREAGHGRTISYSPKVFIPLTHLCRDVCRYCTFAHPPRSGTRGFMTRAEVIAVAQAGAAAGCTEALFTLGEMPETRYAAARDELASLGHATTLSYLAESARAVVEETGLLPHINAGVMSRDDMIALRKVGVSQGLMLEGTAPSLMARGGVHYGSKGKDPAVRIANIAMAGELAIPFTTGILIGIGETRRERVESLLVIAALQKRYGHIQEVIVQNFLPKPGTQMADACAPTMAELLWSAAAARLILGPAMNIQVPPNLSGDRFPLLLESGINDWGGISPVTADHVNPEACWPAVERLRQATETVGLELVARLPVYPRHIGARWIEPSLLTAIRRAGDSSGWSRGDDWSPGMAATPPKIVQRGAAAAGSKVDRALRRAAQGIRLDATEISHLFAARGGEFSVVLEAADDLRARMVGGKVSYVVNRNINYTNICAFKCGFCAFSKGKIADNLRGHPYEVDLDEVSRRAAEAWDRGATEVCMQGGIHPRFTGRTYLDLLAAAKRGAPSIHVHAFSPLEVKHGAATLDMPVERYLPMLRDAGLGSLPGTAAEILHDDIREFICPDKLNTAEWLHIVGAAHACGLPTTSTIMFGHVEAPEHWAAHLLHLRDLQARTGGITEFVPLPFVHMEAPLYYKGLARKGPTYRETLLMHAVARLVLHPLIVNIQASWVKLGGEGVVDVLRAGVNDLGGTLMNESISRAAGTTHGQELPPEEMEALIARAGRVPAQRSTLYGEPDGAQREKSFDAPVLAPLVTGALTGKRKEETKQPIVN